MEEGYDYDAAASTVKIEDITNDEIQQGDSSQLKENDPDFDKLWVREQEMSE